MYSSCSAPRSKTHELKHLMARRREFEKLESRHCLTSIGFADHAIQLSSNFDDAIVADLNGDDHDDVVASLSPGIGISLARTGIVGVGDQRPIVGKGTLLGVEDLDGDGDHDIVGMADGLFWLENDGRANHFELHEIANTPSMSNAFGRAFQAGDVDGDGRIDLTYLANSQQLVTVLNVLDPVVVTSHIRPVPEHSRLRLADFNNDGFLDAVIVRGGSSHWLQWNGSAFEGSSPPDGLPSDGENLTIVDLDHDELPDVLVQLGTLQHYELSPNATRFEFRGSLTDRFGFGFNLQLGDRNGDGLDDVFISITVGGGGDYDDYYVVQQSSPGKFAQAEFLFQRAGRPISRWQVGDLTNSGRDQFILFSRGGILLDHNVTFESPFPLDSIWSMDVGDIDLDGDLDLVTVPTFDAGFEFPAFRTMIVWYENLDGIGGFSSPRMIPVDAFATYDHVWSKLVDFDNDGLLDVVVAFGSDFYWSKNQGAGQGFGEVQELETSAQAEMPRNIDLVDLDQDGLLDFVRSASRSVVSFEQLTPDDAELGETQTLVRVPATIRDLKVADVDADGLLDLLAVYDDNVSWFKNQGQGEFAAAVSIGPCDERRFEVIDVDDDGDLDVLIPSRDTDEVFRWYVNDGDGTFAGPVLGPLRDQLEYFRQIVPGDLDGDGDTDLLAGSAKGIFWFENRDNQFAAEARLFASDFTLSLLVADVNRDDKLDWISASIHETYGLRWHESRTIGDVNADGQFGSADLVAIFTANEYEDDLRGNSTFATGDFNGDGEFDSSDLVLAFKAGHYETVARPLAADVAVAIDWLFFQDNEAKKSRAFVA